VFKTSRKNAQDIRIQSLLEVEAFDGLLATGNAWAIHFGHITPSYATALGSSGDRPAALAELMSILVNDGVRAPMGQSHGLHFAPTRLTTPGCRRSPPRVNAYPPKSRQTVRRALAQVVESEPPYVRGRAQDPAGKPLTIGADRHRRHASTLCKAGNCSNAAWSTDRHVRPSIWETVIRHLTAWCRRAGR